MSNENKQITPMQNVKNFLEGDSVKAKFTELMGKRSSQFITSLLGIVHSNASLAKCDPATIYSAACIAATLDLPINPNLGFAYIIPYGSQAQFQMGYKGFIQLAQRSGQYATINASDVREGEVKHFNRMTGEVVFAWNQTDDRKKLPVIGYVGYFKLMNGFEKNLYMTKSEVEAHGKKYSKAYHKMWTTDFDSMALKTVVKLLISKFGPLSIEMQTAQVADQAVIRNAETMDVDYVDSTDGEISHEDLSDLYSSVSHSLTPEERDFTERVLNTKETQSYAKLHSLLSSK